MAKSQSVQQTGKGSRRKKKLTFLVSLDERVSKELNVNSIIKKCVESFVSFENILYEEQKAELEFTLAYDYSFIDLINRLKSRIESSGFSVHFSLNEIKKSSRYSLAVEVTSATV